MKRIWPKVLLWTVIMVVAASAPVPAALTINFEPGTTQEIQSLIPAPTTGETMAGMAVTFAGKDLSGQPLTPSVPWVATGLNKGEAIFNIAANLFWHTYQEGDTFSQPWNAYVRTDLDSQLSKITLDGFPGGIVFDVERNEYSPKTTGSGHGRTFTLLNYVGTGIAPLPDITVTYRDQVAIQGSPAVGDLYRFLDIEFATFLDRNILNTRLDFLADTDRFIAVVPVPVATPLGSGLSLFATGLLGVIGLRRTWRD